MVDDDGDKIVAAAFFRYKPSVLLSFNSKLVGGICPGSLLNAYP
jgi:hypothetical protein